MGSLSFNLSDCQSALPLEQCTLYSRAHMGGPKPGPRGWVQAGPTWVGPSRAQVGGPKLGPSGPMLGPSGWAQAGPKPEIWDPKKSQN